MLSIYTDNTKQKVAFIRSILQLAEQSKQCYLVLGQMHSMYVRI